MGTKSNLLGVVDSGQHCDCQDIWRSKLSSVYHVDYLKECLAGILAQFIESHYYHRKFVVFFSSQEVSDT